MDRQQFTRNAAKLNKKTLYTWLFLILVIILLSLFTVYRQISTLGNSYLLTEQIERHEKVINHRAGSPWQYRVLSAWLVELSLPSPEIEHYSDKVLRTFFSLRIAQNSLIFLLAFLYFRQLGISDFWSFVGLGILGWTLSYSLYDSDLSLNTYFDVIFFLLGVLAFLKGHDWSIPLIMIFASLNRETCILLPFLYLGYKQLGIPLTQLKPEPQTWIVFGSSVSIFLLTFIGLRVYFPSQAIIKPYGFYPGLELFYFNLIHFRSYYNLFASFSIFPFLSLFNYSKWDNMLKAFFWILIPLWITVHLFGGIIAETRLFLVPFVLVIVPGVLVGHTYTFQE
ncbi:MAG: hypothetical protein AAF694_23985 [Bacteroidota bacterium]